MSHARRPHYRTAHEPHACFCGREFASHHLFVFHLRRAHVEGVGMKLLHQCGQQCPWLHVPVAARAETRF